MDKIFEIEPIETFNAVCEDIVLNLYVHKLPVDTDLEPRVVQVAKEDIMKLIETTNLNIDFISEQLQNKGWNEDKVNSLISIIETKKTKLMYATILHYNSKYGHTVQNFDWALKLVKGTNDLKTLSYPLLQLNFSLRNSEGDLKQILYDLNKDMLKKLINVLENKDNL